MRPALIRRVALASQRRLKSTAAAHTLDPAGLSADIEALAQDSKSGPAGATRKKSRKGKKAAKRPEPAPEPADSSKKTSKPGIQYEMNAAARSMERMAFFAGADPDVEVGGLADIEEAEDVPGIEVGRVVEMRR